MNRLVLKNKKAQHNYEIIETYIAGIELKGVEVVALRNKKLSFSDSFISVNNEVFWKNAHISLSNQSDFEKVSENRNRKLLLHKKEILKIRNATNIKGYTVIPLELILSNNKFKLKIGVAKGLKKYDKRLKEKEKTLNMEIKRSFKSL